jgi:uncharacterized protein (TIGR00251 family)
MSALELKVAQGRVTFPVRVVPRASRTEMVGVTGGALRIRLSAPPVEGAANRALIRFLAKRLGVGRYQLEIIAGAKGRDKIIAVEGLTASEVARRLVQAD